MKVNAVADMAVEQPLELAERDAGLAARAPPGLRGFDAGLHGAQHREQLLVGDAQPIAEIHALRAEAFADMRVQEPVADGGRELAP